MRYVNFFDVGFTLFLIAVFLISSVFALRVCKKAGSMMLAGVVIVAFQRAAMYLIVTSEFGARIYGWQAWSWVSHGMAVFGYILFPIGVSLLAIRAKAIMQRREELEILVRELTK